jgi:hypothetical protein
VELTRNTAVCVAASTFEPDAIARHGRIAADLPVRALGRSDDLGDLAGFSRS